MALRVQKNYIKFSRNVSQEENIVIYRNRNPMYDKNMAVKAKAAPLHAMRAHGERRYSSYSFSISALDGDKWSASRPGRALAPEKGPPLPIG
jgi:hypothetical protein